MTGKSIRIYLADGSVSGIRHGEIVNWSGQAISCPRTRFADLKEWAEARRPGVYFLFGIDEETGRDVVYIGEAEVVTERVSSHISGKDFWSELVAFTSKDDNLTKGHIRYLEARLVQVASSAGRYILKNAVSPQLPALPRADRDAMEEFIESVRTLLGVLGHRALEPLTMRSATEPAVTAAPLPSPSRAMPRTVPSEPTNFCLRIGGITAAAIRTDEGIVVLAGSDAAPDVQRSLSMGYRSLRERLIASGVITQANGKCEFARDNLFSSPSQAAAVLVGYAINGRDAWKTKEGRTWGQVEEAAAKQLLDELLQSKQGPSNTALQGTAANGRP
jgi:hypothetical protein